MASREFWQEVGAGEEDYDARVGEVCALLCSEFRSNEVKPMIASLVAILTSAARPIIGDSDGNLDLVKLFRAVNK
jgi:hypothetical protein